MDLDDQFDLEHLFLTERKCRSCGIRKSLTDSFYRIRKNNTLLSSYAYECKECTVKRVIVNRMATKVFDKWEYPDW